MNKVILMGNITRDPENSQTNSGISYTRFSIAVNRRFTNAEGEREVDFINCTAWRSTADFVAKYFKKGSKILVIGSIQTRQYDAQDGSKRTATDVVVDEVYFTGGRQDGGANSEAPDAEPKAAGKSNRQAKLEPVEEDDLPF